MLHECFDLLRRQRAFEAVLLCFIFFVVIVSSVRPEDAEFFPGTLPLDTDGKEVRSPQEQLHMTNTACATHVPYGIPCYGVAELVFRTNLRTCLSGGIVFV
jgi:hypothetical protein